MIPWFHVAKGYYHLLTKLRQHTYRGSNNLLHCSWWPRTMNRVIIVALLTTPAPVDILPLFLWLSPRSKCSTSMFTLLFTENPTNTYIKRPCCMSMSCKICYFQKAKLACKLKKASVISGSWLITARPLALDLHISHLQAPEEVRLPRWFVFTHHRENRDID